MLDILLKTHEDHEKIDFASLWRKGVFVFDANVLLDIYRLPESASNDLIEVLKDNNLTDRIWIGFQVVLEFLNNRHEAISDQKNKFNTVRGLLEDAINQYDEVMEKLLGELAKLKLKQRHSLIDPEKFMTPKNISGGKVFIEDFVDELSILESKQSDVNDLDQIKTIVLDLFDGKIGEGFSKKELEEIYKIGEKRYDNNVPPGYKDKAKPGLYAVGDKEFLRKFGDLVLWKEIIRKAKSENLPYIILVTGDVKEDWWLEKRGKKLGPRKELLNEIYTEAPGLLTFYMYDTANFLKHAKTHLKVDIKDSSITQAKDLIEKSRKNRFASEEGFVNLPEIVKSVAIHFDGFRVGVGRSVGLLPALRISEITLYQSLMEIFHNALVHGVHSYVGVQAKDRGEAVLLRFKNRISTVPDSALPNLSADRTIYTGSGLQKVQEMMSFEAVEVRIVQSGKSFVVEFYIPKNRFLNGSNFTVSQEAV